MRHVILRLFFGTDEIVTHMGKVLTLRRQAIAAHVQKAKAAVELNIHTEKLEALKVQHAWAKQALEDSYRLELN